MCLQTSFSKRYTCAGGGVVNPRDPVKDKAAGEKRQNARQRFSASSIQVFNIPVSLLFCPPQLRKTHQEMYKPQKGVGQQGTGLWMAMEKRDN